MIKPIVTTIPEIGAKIRRTQDGKCSLYDLIGAAGKGNPRRTWDDLKSRHPEVVRKAYNFKFPGRGQRNTPVVVFEDWLYILGLLPGAMGSKYREEAANLVTRYIQGDAELALDVIDRNDNPEELKRIEKRAKSKVTRNRFTATLAKHGVEGRGYADCTNSLYVGLHGGTAKQLMRQRGLKKGDSLRDSMTASELSEVDFAEDLATQRLGKVDAKGNQQCAAETFSVARKVAALKSELLNE